MLPATVARLAAYSDGGSCAAATAAGAAASSAASSAARAGRTGAASRDGGRTDERRGTGAPGGGWTGAFTILPAGHDGFTPGPAAAGHRTYHSRPGRRIAARPRLPSRIPLSFPSSSASLDLQLDVETPEQVAFSYTIAGVGSRAAAALLDGAICVAAYALLVYLVTLAADAAGGRSVSPTSSTWGTTLL